MRWNTIDRKIIVNQSLCIRCLKCIKSCPAEILIQEQPDSSGSKKFIKVVNPELCFECRACEIVCPVLAINVMCAIQSVSAP
ncbi:MAG: 4Fe-4S binding protein [Promethearchaeota archaeon]